MKKSPIAIAIAIVALSLNTVFAQVNGSAGPACGFQLSVPQPQYPLILLQPDDECMPFGSNATFSVTALNANGYQWLFNGNAITNGTNSILVIQNAGIQNVGYYSCDVFKDFESVPTRSASLQVFTNWIDPQTGVDPMVVYSFPCPGGGSQGNCPGHFIGYVNYTKPYTNGWGWTPDTTNGNTVFTATDANQTNTKIEYVGEWADEGCSQTTVTVPNPPISPAYRFTIYFTNNVPTNAYPITLSGFNP
ncbi:MAG TPA: immunoglobulin domain-containing protein [Verrucomicrobiae bacterium]|nr:immunoglobulin domain-containing protein [Verrucomicrobiae bacterium]